MAVVAIMMGYDVLVHCRAGTYRSGSLVVLILALLTGTDLPTAMHTYLDRHRHFHRSRDLTLSDQASAPLQIRALCGHF
jgi:protein-tyrosine phosphatase